ncbi:MAG: DNA cytosine methyltransferase [Clostridiales bacterium]|nr:DNA cytosine methyltransferase [Clostridiales bacterium]
MHSRQKKNSGRLSLGKGVIVIKHLGDICKINGAEIEPVDVISAGSPCQDLSVAGLRKGLQHTDKGDGETTRSGLFMEQMRVIKEMRNADSKRGRADDSVRPRYLVWENVPGALSSGKDANGKPCKGADFQAVLTEIVKVVEPTTPDVPLPDGGKWAKQGCLYGVGINGIPFSVAYKVHDAQFYGVPQRRKRLVVLADFNGLTAAGILFDPQLERATEGSESDFVVGSLGAGSRSEI